MVKHYLIKRGMLKCPTFIWKITWWLTALEGRSKEGIRDCKGIV